MTFIHLRQARIDDLEQIVDAIENVFLTHIPLDEEEKLIKDIQEKDHIYVAYKDETLAGFIETTYRNHNMELELLGVQEDFQKQGIGKSLIYFALGNYMRRKRVETVSLYYNDYQSRAYYEQLGFVKDTSGIIQRSKLMTSDAQELYRQLTYSIMRN